MGRAGRRTCWSMKTAPGPKLASLAKTSEWIPAPMVPVGSCTSRHDCEAAVVGRCLPNLYVSVSQGGSLDREEGAKGFCMNEDKLVPMLPLLRI